MNIRSNPPSKLGSIQQRMAMVLLKQAQAPTASRAGCSLHEMAESLNISREMADKSLSFLRSEGAIRIERHRLFVNQTALERIISIEA